MIAEPGSGRRAMSSDGPPDFDTHGLYEALNSRRESRGLTWAQVMRGINELFKDVPGIRPVAASTVTRMRGKRVNEGDGALQMLQWLERSPEDFIPGGASRAASLPKVKSSVILRFDLPAIYTALDSRRGELGLSWPQVAEQVGGISAGGLKRLAKPGRTSIQTAARIARWLNVSVASLTGEFTA